MLYDVNFVKAQSHYRYNSCNPICSRWIIEKQSRSQPSFILSLILFRYNLIELSVLIK